MKKIVDFLRDLAEDTRIPFRNRVVFMGLLLYVLTPIDIIPDFIPILGWLIRFVVAIWGLVIAVIAVREVLDYSSTGRAIIVCLIAAVVCWIVLVLVMLPFIAAAFVAKAALGS